VVHGAERDSAGSPPDHQCNGDRDDGESQGERGGAIHTKVSHASPWPLYLLEKEKRITELW
jgi:hypothetical protein